MHVIHEILTLGKHMAKSNHSFMGVVIPNDLLKKLKETAKWSDRSLSSLVQEILKEWEVKYDEAEEKRIQSIMDGNKS